VTKTKCSATHTKIEKKCAKVTRFRGKGFRNHQIKLPFCVVVEVEEIGGRPDGEDCSSLKNKSLDDEF
jgi:hypothetical protein